MTALEITLGLNLMNNIIFYSIIFSSFSFIVYGISSFFSNKMIGEYERWGFSKKRKLIGTCQLLGGIGLLLGLKYNLFVIISSLCLAAMMLFAVLVRIRVRDGFLQTLPAIGYMALNAYILYNAI